ncbi:MAG TPA: type I 3-dehydroquinate dehydratase [Thermoplasmata archaeon]|nr:type I 3-dehydroquinate dehydratase [Thermoplasmata archaeon]
MNPPPPAIVVTLPARTIAEARSQMELAKASGADLIEIRFDRFPAAELKRVGELFPSQLPLLATLRSRAEGGEGPDDPVERARVLNELAQHRFRWMDVELARDLPNAKTLTHPGERALVVSSHPRATVRSSEWSDLLRTTVPDGSIRKVVIPATIGQLLRELIPQLPPPGESSLVALTTGPSGPLLRIWSRKFGFPLVYCSLPEGSGDGTPPPVEPSQIPVDRLRPYLHSDGIPPLFAVVGHPVAHSRSPALHSRWMAEGGRVGLYVALDFENDQEFVESIPSLIDGGFRGLNVTHPFKQVALELAGRVDPGASACGVANTLSLGQDEVEAENTDLAAVLRRLEELRSSGRWDGASVGVVGAGGAARATLAAARSLEVKAFVRARRPEAADAIAREFGAEAYDASASGRPTLVVHATPIGREAPGASLAPEMSDWLRPGVHVVDWVYAPENPVIRSSAERAGATYEEGSRLLVYQAAASYGIWWGDEPSPEQVSTALEGIA